MLELTDAAVATSGAYERGAHVLDPVGGGPARGALSVTVIGRSLGSVDAYATAAFAMGRRGPEWTARLRGCEAMTVLDDGEVLSTQGWLRATSDPCRVRHDARRRTGTVMGVPQPHRRSGPLRDTLEGRERWPGRGPWSLPVDVWRGARAHRTTGHAAEMAFFAVLTLVPSTIAVGSALGFSENLVGSAAVAKAEAASSDAVRVLMGPELADVVITPFVHAQLTQPHRDVAIGALLIAWWLSSHLFMATSHALDDCYGVHDHRPTIVQRFIALAFALASVAVVAVTAEMMVSGPLGELTGDPARTLGIEGAYERGVVGRPLADRVRARGRLPHLPLPLQRQRAPPLARLPAGRGRRRGPVDLGRRRRSASPPARATGAASPATTRRSR